MVVEIKSSPSNVLFNSFVAVMPRSLNECLPQGLGVIHRNRITLNTL